MAIGLVSFLVSLSHDSGPILPGGSWARKASIHHGCSHRRHLHPRSGDETSSKLEFDATSLRQTSALRFEQFVHIVFDRVQRDNDNHDDDDDDDGDVKK